MNLIAAAQEEIDLLTKQREDMVAKHAASLTRIDARLAYLGQAKKLITPEIQAVVDALGLEAKRG